MASAGGAVERGVRLRKHRRDQGLINDLDTDASLAPMSALGVVSDSVTGSKADPLRDGSVLLLCSGELDFCAERLVARHFEGCRVVFSRVMLCGCQCRQKFRL